MYKAGGQERLGVGHRQQEREGKRGVRDRKAVPGSVTTGLRPQTGMARGGELLHKTMKSGI